MDDTPISRSHGEMSLLIVALFGFIAPCLFGTVRWRLFAESAKCGFCKIRRGMQRVAFLPYTPIFLYVLGGGALKTYKNIYRNNKDWLCRSLPYLAPLGALKNGRPFVHGNERKNFFRLCLVLLFLVVFIVCYANVLL